MMSSRVAPVDGGARAREFSRVELRTRASLEALSTLNAKRLRTIDIRETTMLYDELDVNNDGSLTMDDFEQGQVSEERVVGVTRSKTLRHLVSTPKASKRRAMLSKLDKDSDGKVTRDEWQRYVQAMATERVRYLKVQGLLHHQCYWGLGVDEPCDTVVEAHARRILDACAWIFRTEWPVGFVSDFSFYVANHHNLLALFARDADHPVSAREQMTSFVLIQTWSLWVAVHLAVDNYLFVGGTFIERLPFVAHHLSSFALITCPALFATEFFILLFACPCVQVEKEDSDRRLVCLQNAAEAAGHLLVAPLFAVGVFLTLDTVRIFLRYHDDGLDVLRFVLDYAAGITLTYTLWPLKTLCIQFNLYEGRCIDCLRRATFGEVARWRHERAQVLRSSTPRTVVVAQQPTADRSDSPVSPPPDAPDEATRPRSATRLRFAPDV